MKHSLSELNQMNQDDFVAVLGWIFEDSPWIAQKAWARKPFADVLSLHQSMVDVVCEASDVEKLALICAHPDLGAKAKMAEASVKEQAGVGLDRLNPEEYDKFNYLNQAYKKKFNFPFIIAVKNHTKESILASFSQRLENSKETELQTVLAEIEKIALFRLQEVIDDK
ncbi:2-oxo-4-hydroxy-4-carboxy-5-ureidoimidazoline decarboxylase [Gloeocapsopsis crepidinum LEGE 06123]|uniref:2-oxo-4-hydroxy-4-carboxy-5-ureidoimidazoline decarboxylase n=1 Tax=Gloeocapsopsis crepidinum LEGE 06123 TaxID=588587 RepID=A0ABR9UWV1_9CHRO|nr:2-oxo-4-hydroxy-4-carboxy-5-ureidoimidazoline decarboxylase [Gloeocapsopsis crepidinum]MBE9192055.1 2-oxo-4-hydroxy-4-carboxy-5-ureidoimidazoline decarboxylase [Gloeocapsopsis crepidinum LEGE 06123]